MTDDDIRKLAQSYVDELFYGDDMSDQENIENKNDALVLCLAFVGHIMEKHCIVEKEKVREKYALYKMGYTECEGLELGYVMDALEEIFGRELFNDTEK